MLQEYPDYPETTEVEARVYISYTVKDEVPIEWTRDEIIDYIQNNIGCYWEHNKKIEDIDILTCVCNPIEYDKEK